MNNYKIILEYKHRRPYHKNYILATSSLSYRDFCSWFKKYLRLNVYGLYGFNLYKFYIRKTRRKGEGNDMYGIVLSTLNIEEDFLNLVKILSFQEYNDLKNSYSLFLAEKNAHLLKSHPMSYNNSLLKLRDQLMIEDIIK